MDVKRVLDSKPVTGAEAIGSQETMGNLVQKLREKRIGAMMVTDQADKLVGVISERDVIRALAEDGEVCLRSPVSRYMTQEVQATAPQENVFTVLDRMTQGRFRHMPVMEGEAIVGVVSIGDVVKARIESLQRDNAALEEFIRS